MAAAADTTSATDAPAAAGPVGTYEALAATRPRIRRDVLFTETPGGVLFHNADGGFHLTGRTAYRFASLLVPHLMGEHRLAEICNGLGPAQRTMAAELVKTLYERGFARDTPVADPADGADRAAQPSEEVARRFAAQISYVDHYTDGAPARFQRFRDTAVAVLGRDAVARWCALSLVRNGAARVGLPDGADTSGVAEEEARELRQQGCPVRIDRLPGGEGSGWNELADWDVVLVTGNEAAPRVHRLLAEGVPQGRTLIPVWSFGARAVVGPLSTAGGTGCFSCALLRMGANVDAGAAADVWREIAGAGTGVAVPSGAGPYGGHDGYGGHGGYSDYGDYGGFGDYGDAAAGPLSGPVAAMVGNLLGYEVFRLTTGALPAETERQVLVQDLESLDVVADPVQPHPRCRLCAAVAGTAGTAEGRAQPLPDGLATAATPTVETAREAEELVEELNRIGAALVRPYTGVFTRYDDEELTQTPLKVSRVQVPLGHGAARLITAFDVHHLAGARLRALHTAAVAYVEHVVPAGGRPPSGTGSSALPRMAPAALSTGGGTGAGTAEIASWTLATSLRTKEPVLVPTAAVRPFGPHNRDRLHLATSAGAGAGGSPQEAAGRGLLSALGHEALLRAVRGTGRVSVHQEPVAAGPADGADPELVFLLKSARNLNTRVELLDLGEGDHSSVSVVLAREPREHGGAGRWALGCELSRDAAACAALRDLLGQVQLAAETGTEADLGDPLLRDLDPAAVAVTAAPSDGGVTDWEAVLGRLRETGRDVLVVPTTPGDLAAGGFATVRVLLTTGSGGAGAATGEGGVDAHR